MAWERTNAPGSSWAAALCLARLSEPSQVAEKAPRLGQLQERAPAQERRSSRRAKKFTCRRKPCFGSNWIARCRCICGRELSRTFKAAEKTFLFCHSERSEESLWNFSYA